MPFSSNVRQGLGPFVRPVSGIFTFDRSASRWGDVRSPDADIVVDTTGTGSLVAATGSLTFVTYGAPSKVNSQFYPNGFSAACMPAAKLNGSSDRYTVGGIANMTGSFSVGLIASDVPIVSAGGLIGRYNTTRQWILYQSNATLSLFVVKAGGIFSASNGVVFNPVNNNSACICASYQYITDGTSILNIAINGTAATAVTNAVGAPQSSSDLIEIGAWGNGSGGTFWGGKIERISLWYNEAFSSAQLVEMTNSQMGSLTRKP